MRWRSAVRWPVGGAPSARAVRTARSARRRPSQTAWWTSRVSSSARSSATAARSGASSPRSVEVEEVRGEQHRPLGVALAGGDEARDRVGVELDVLRLGQAQDVGDRVLGGQRRQLERPRLAVERALAVG